MIAPANLSRITIPPLENGDAAQPCRIRAALYGYSLSQKSRID